MANPQCEDGYTRIANELLEAIVRTRLPGQELRIMLAVIRMTYGYGKKQDQISYGQLSKITNIPRPRVIEHVKSLVSKKGLGSLNHGTRQPLTIWINKDFDKWVPSPIKETSPNHETIPSLNHETKASPNHETLQRKKEIRKKEYKELILPEWLESELWNDFKDHRNKLRKPMTRKAEEMVIKKCEWLKGKGYNPKHLILTAIERGWQTVFEPKEQ